LCVLLATAGAVVVALAGVILSALEARAEIVSVTYTLSWVLLLVAMREL